MCIYIYIYIHKHTHIYIPPHPPNKCERVVGGEGSPTRSGETRERETGCGGWGGGVTRSHFSLLPLTLSSPGPKVRIINHAVATPLGFRALWFRDWGSDF